MDAQVDHKTTTKQKVGEQCKGEKEFIAQCNAQFEAAKERSIPHCSGEAPTNRKDFLAAKQQHIEDSSKDYSALMMTPGSVAVLESAGHLIPHASTKARGGVSKQNAVLLQSLSAYLLLPKTQPVCPVHLEKNCSFPK